MALSKFGQHFSAESGIVDLMDDLGKALNVDPDLLFLGGGNPAQIDEFEDIIAQQLTEISKSPSDLHRLIGVYQSPQGSESFIEALSDYFKSECQWPIEQANIAVANGSQSAFFMLINMLTGPSLDPFSASSANNQSKAIHFPLMPEYLGYADQALADDAFVGHKPLIELVGEHGFKYKVDFDKLNIDENAAAICVSRPTNPSGNMISDEELNQLSDIAEQRGIPLIIDCAYGDPFPGIVYQQTQYQWKKHHILVMSLSKLGLPAVRTGIVVADQAFIKQFVSINTIVSLANGNLGPELMTRLLKQNKLSQITQTILLPFYQAKRDFFSTVLKGALGELPYRFHQAEGAFFLWLWFEGLPISSTELYQRLKEQGVLIMDGKPFFFNIDEKWPHKQECIRLSYCQSDEILAKAAKIIGQLLHELYDGKTV